MKTEFNPLVSIILPVYNAQDYVSETIQSVVRQSYQNWELVVVDDCSSDQSWSLVEALAKGDSRITPLRLERNSGGPALPRNTGIEKSKGELLAFIDSDDVWHPDKLRIQLKYFQQSKMDFCCTDIQIFSEEFQEEDVDVLDSRLDKISQADLLKINLIPLSTVLAKKDLFQIDRFYVGSDYAAIEDYELWLRIHSREIDSFKLLLPLTYYRLREDSLSSSKLMMLRKRFFVLNNFRLNGKRLGLSKYYYLFCYIFESLIRRVN